MFFKSKKTENVVTQPKPLSTKTRAIIEQIHDDFDTGSQKLLDEALLIINKETKTDKGERISSLGFTAAKPAVEAQKIVTEKREKESLAGLIRLYQQVYPFNKFITEDVVKIICKKYNLVFGKAEWYIGDIPEKNVLEMENFKLREEDYEKNYNSWYSYKDRYFQHEGSEKNDRASYYGYPKWREVFGGQEFVHRPKDEAVHLVRIPFKICAPRKDFIKNLDLTDTYNLSLNIPDPVVLQPVIGGYLIITKWGLEAEDKYLLNEKMN